MRRSAVSLAALALAAGILGTLAMAAGPAPTIDESGTANFPEKAYVLGFATKTVLKPGSGRRDRERRRGRRRCVVPANAAGGQGIGTVLLIDASNSMRGEPIKAATEAARAFVARVPGQPVSVITFNDEVLVTLPFTVDQKAIANALAGTPTLAEGTHIYDGVTEAVQQIRDAKLGAGRIVLLSDGADVGSSATIDDAKKALEDSGVRLFSVGLKSPAYDPAPLEDLAAASGGAYVEASSTEDLNAIYGELGTKASNEYLVSYRSLLGPNEEAKVKIAVAGYPPLTSVYRTPALEPSAPYTESTWDKIIGSPITMLIVVIGVLALLGAAIAQFVRARRDSNLRKRLGAFVTIPADEQSRQRKEDVQRALAVASDRSFRRSDVLSRFADECEIADITIPPMRIVYWTVAATALTGLLLIIIFGKPVFALFALLLPLTVRFVVTRKLKRKRKAFGEQLPDNLEVLSVRAPGRSQPRPDHSPWSWTTPMSRRRVSSAASSPDEQLGVPLDEALEVVVKRMDNRDLDQVAILAGLQRETGGNMAEVLDRVVENVRGRMEIRRLIQTLTAQGRMARWIVSLLPSRSCSVSPSSIPTTSSRSSTIRSASQPSCSEPSWSSPDRS